MTPPPPADDPVVSVVRGWCTASGLDWESPEPATFVVVLPGERKQRTATSVTVGNYHVTVQAFVARHPDEAHDRVHQWLLERNLRMYGIAWAIDHLGDIYLTGRMSREACTAAELDRVMGAVLENADSGFNTILELGFATAIRKEWAWRLSRGEPTGNLAAFEHLRPDA